MSRRGPWSSRTCCWPSGCSRDRRRKRPQRAGHPGPQPRIVHGPLLLRRLPPPPGPVHGQVAALRAPAWPPTSSATAACFPCAGATTMRRRSRPPSACWLRVRPSSCTARVGGRGPGTSRLRPSRASAGWRWSRARRWSPWRSSAHRRFATGSASSSPKVARPVRRAVPLRAVGGRRRASSSRRRPTTSWSGSGRSIPSLAEHGYRTAAREPGPGAPGPGRR